MSVLHRSAAIVRGLASLTITALLVVGVPFGLVTLVGWPLPRQLPTGDGLSRAMSSGVSDDFIVNALAVIAWLAWTQLALALVAEAVALVRHHEPRRLPVAPGLQATAARLVAGIVLLVTPLQPARIAAAELRPAPVVVATSTTLSQAAPAATHHPPPMSPTGQVVVGRTVDVQRHDTYWSIAERELGDGLQWRRILDLNVGRRMPDGHTIFVGDETLRTGWVLHLPDESPVVTDGAHEVVVGPGDNLWELSEERLTGDLRRAPSNDEVAPYWLRTIDANRGRLLDPQNPGLIHPGQTLILPATTASAPSPPGAQPTPAPERRAAPEPSTAPEPPAADAPATPVPSTAAPHSTQPRPSEVSQGRSEEATDDGAPSPLPWLVTIGGLSSVALAVGAKRTIERRRRRFRQEHPGQSSPPTPDRDRWVHRKIVANADDATIGDLRSALAHLASCFFTIQSGARPRLIRHGEHSLEVLMDRPIDVVPPGWRTDHGDRLLVWAGEGDPSDEMGECACPLLVTLGQPEEGAQLYLDLEAHGLIELTGDPEAARALARSIATEVVLSPLTDTVRIVVVGDLLGCGTSTLDHLRVVDTWHDVAADVTAWAEQSHRVLVESGWSSTFAARGPAPAHEVLAPLLVVSAKAPPPEIVDHLRSHLPATLAIVVADPFEGSLCTIDCQPEMLTLTDLEVACIPQQLEEDTLASILRILANTEPQVAEPAREDEAHDEPGERLGEDLPLDHGGLSAPFDVPLVEERDGRDGAGEPDGDDHGPETIVRLLGDIRVEGPDPLPPKATAVLAYLALHRSVTIEALEDACWADPTPSTRRLLRDVMVDLRNAVGSHNLPVAADNRYSVGPGVVTDTQLFDRLIARAVDEPPAEQAAAYRSALELVTGKILTYPGRSGSSFGWIDTENLRSRWELRIESAALECIETYMDLGAADRAVEVADHILQALPLSTPITEALMRAHANLGNTRAVETVFRAHAEGLQRLLKTDPEVTTVDLRTHLIAG